MILGRRALPGLALCVALVSLSAFFYAGIGEAPKAFFGNDLFLVTPPEGKLLGQEGVEYALAGALRAQDGVRLVSPEIYLPTAIGGRSLIARGVEFDAFLQVEGARLVEGRLPQGDHEALVGAGWARATGVGAGDRIFIPGAFTRTGLSLEVVGVYDTPSPARDEVLVTLGAGRTLAGGPPDEVHLIRVASDDPRRLKGLIESVGSTFSYSDVRLSSTTFYAGETVVVQANLTNWGRVGAYKTVTVRDGEEPVAEKAYFVGPLQTIPVEVPFTVGRAGASNISINPTFPVTVREGSLSFVEVPGVAYESRPASFRLRNSTGSPAAGIEVTAGNATGTTDANGTVVLALRQPGRLDILARGDVEAGEVAFAQTYVVAANQSFFPSGAVTAIEPPATEVGTRRPVTVRVEAENRGGVGGPAPVYLLVDGEVAAEANLTLQPGERAVVNMTFGPLAPGNHTIGARNSTVSLRIVAFEGDDPRIEALLRAYEARVLDPSLGASSGDSATSYIERTVGDVGLAVLVLSIASGALATLGVLAVLARHLAESRHAMGVLKAVGASDAHVVDIATREAALHGGQASLAGIAVAVALSWLLDLTGYLRGFGHAVHPVYDWTTLGLLFVLGTLVTVVATRALVSSALRTPADALLRGAALRREAPRQPTLAHALEERP